MGKKTSFKKDFQIFSGYLEEISSPISKWLWKHALQILIGIIALGFVWKSIIHHYIDKWTIGQSLAAAAAEAVKVVFLYVIPGFVAFLLILFVLSVLATVWEKKRKSAEASKVEDIPNQQPLCPKITDAAEVKTPENRKQIKGALLKKYLDTPTMDKPYCAGKTVFDGIVDSLSIVLLQYRKGAKSPGAYTDKDIVQIANLLYRDRYMKRSKAPFTEWCNALFEALGLEPPKDIKNQEPEDKVRKLFLFMDRI